MSPARGLTLALVAASVILVPSESLRAQQSSASGERYGGGIFVNNEVLSRLGSEGAAPAVAPTAGPSGLSFPLQGQGSFVLSRPGTLLFPPRSPPRSGLTPRLESTLAGVSASSPATAQPTRNNADEPADSRGSTPQSRLLIPLPHDESGYSAGDQSPSGTVVITGDDPVPQVMPVPGPLPAPRAGVSQVPLPAPEAPPAPKSKPLDLARATPIPEQAPQAAAQPDLEGVLTLLFSPASAELNAKARDRLEAIAEALISDRVRSIHVEAFADGADGGDARARQLSLSRALVVRDFLVQRGVVAEQIRVRGFGSDFGDGPPDRVDIVPDRS